MILSLLSKKLPWLWGVLALAAAALACLLFAAGVERGPLYVRYAQSPEEAAAGFLEAVCAGDYGRADGYLEGSGSLTPEEPEEADAALLLSALRQSYAYELTGPAETEGLNAAQTLQLRCLDLNALAEPLRERITARLEELVGQRDYDEIYDEQHQYRPEITEAVYREALSALLAEPEAYTGEKRLTLSLRYDGRQWRILPDAALLNALGQNFGSAAHNLKSAALEGLSYIRKIYRLPEEATAGSPPDPDGFGSTADPAVIQALIDASAELLEGQDTVWSPEIQLYPGTQYHYYRDDTILAISWCEKLYDKCCTFIEVRIADGSQLRRKLVDDRYDSAHREYGSQLAGEANAVAATNGDFYTYRQVGLTVYRRQLYRFDAELLDTCFFTSSGDMLMVPRGSFADRAAAEQYIAENDVLFSAAFGPILVEDGQLQEIGGYPIGEITRTYSRSAIGMTDKLHYLLLAINYANGAPVAATVQQEAQIMFDKGCVRAYALDGGQTSQLCMGTEILNNVDWDAERQVSDIIYFASALPEEREV